MYWILWFNSQRKGQLQVVRNHCWGDANRNNREEQVPACFPCLPVSFLGSCGQIRTDLDGKAQIWLAGQPPRTEHGRDDLGLRDSLITITSHYKKGYFKIAIMGLPSPPPELDHKDSWAPKNWCFWTVVLENTLASPLDCKEIQPVHHKGDQSWVFIGRTDAKAETPILWPPDANNWLLGTDPDAGTDWRQEEKGTTGDEMVGWHHWTWVWVNSRSWRWTGRPGVLQSMGLQRVGHDCATELNWTGASLVAQQ